MKVGFISLGCSKNLIDTEQKEKLPKAYCNGMSSRKVSARTK